MNKFRVVIESNFVHFLIDDKDLLETLTDFETPFAGNLAGEYDYLNVNEIDRLEFLTNTSTRRVMLFGCNCGIRACWPMEIKIELTKDSVVWKDFVLPFRLSWNYSKLGPFVFERAEYESEIAKIKA